jgi:ribosomal protein S24E
MMTKQVLSKQRVADHGEVFTSQREVNAMLDFVKQETERIDSRFLEPACGTGNFLNEILRRKLQVVEKRYKRSQIEFERYAVLAVSSIYGIDIQEDNVRACRQRLSGLFSEIYTKIYKKKARIECIRAVQYILEKNIIHGDALTLKTADISQPITFSEWSFTGSMVKRRDFMFSSLLPDDQPKVRDLFSQGAEKSDLGEDVFLPKETHGYPAVHFLRVGEEENV